MNTKGYMIILNSSMIFQFLESQFSTRILSMIILVFDDYMTIVLVLRLALKSLMVLNEK